jgi:hypothetical protein
MAKRFDDLADEVMEAWPAEAHQVYQAARGAFQAEMCEQAELGGFRESVSVVRSGPAEGVDGAGLTA